MNRELGGNSGGWPAVDRGERRDVDGDGSRNNEQEVGGGRRR